MSAPPTPPSSPFQHTSSRSTTPSIPTVATEQLPSSRAQGATCPPCAPAAQNDDDGQIVAFYERRYPGSIPHPRTIVAVAPSPPRYYVVTAGRQVGVFVHWPTVSTLVTGISGAKFKGYRRFHQAWLAYYREYAGKAIQILDDYQDTAPLHTQLVDIGLEHLVHDLSL
ncbi:hypothetical protein PQX77_020268 [Marasmius sp. AFHP31]|nr:hypothetical protein PQX77_020268 [Marasmius sp. AFHP31]